MKILFAIFILIPTLCFANEYSDKRAIDFKESYRTMNNGRIQRQSDLASIPQTTENEDYRIYLEDVKNSAEVLPFDYEAERIRQETEQAKLNLKKQQEELIQAKLREQAIISLKAEGKLPIDYKDK